MTVRFSVMVRQVREDGSEAPLDGELAAALAAPAEQFAGLAAWAADEARFCDHGEREKVIGQEGRELQRRLLQATFDIDSAREERASGVTSAAGIPHGSVEEGHGRGLASVFGPVRVTRLAYRNRREPNLYPADARCLVHESMAPGLAAAAALLRPRGEALVFWDCYRPHDVQVRMFEAVPDPNWVARPGPYARSHEAGRSVDVTIANAAGPVDMGTDFDDFTPRALAYATEDVSAAAQANRARLRDAMSAGGLTVYKGEWWHFDTSDAYEKRPILNVAVN